MNHSYHQKQRVVQPVLSCLLLMVLILTGYNSQAQQVSTILDSGSGIDDAVFISSDGTIYMSSFSDGIFSKYKNGVRTVIADTLGNSNGIAGDSKGNVFVIDYLKGIIYKYVDSTTTLSVINDQMTNPSGLIKMWNSDTLIVTSYTKDSLYKIAPDGQRIPFMGGAPLNGPVGLTYDSLGTLYIGNFDGMEILKVHAADSVSVVCTLPSNRQGFITYAGGNIYATVLGNHSIYKVNPDSGTFYRFTGGLAGHVDGHADTAKFNRPNGIVATPDGDTLYVTEFSSDRLRMITGVLNPVPADTLGVRRDIENNRALRIHTYPNPVISRLNIPLPQGMKVRGISVYNEQGVLQRQSDTVPRKGGIEVDVSMLSSGMYFAVISTTKGIFRASFSKE